METYLSLISTYMWTAGTTGTYGTGGYQKPIDKRLLANLDRKKKQDKKILKINK